MALYKHLLLATDVCVETEYVCKQAEKLAKLFQSKMSLIHVIEPIPAYGYPEGAELESPYIDQARAELTKIGKKLNVDPKDQYLEFGSVKSLVLDKAKELGVDLIVIGSHGRHGLSRILGSTASAVVHGAECDVITVRYKA